MFFFFFPTMKALCIPHKNVANNNAGKNSFVEICLLKMTFQYLQILSGIKSLWHFKIHVV